MPFSEFTRLILLKSHYLVPAFFEKDKVVDQSSSWENPHWREALQLQLLWWSSFPTLTPPPPHPIGHLDKIYTYKK